MENIKAGQVITLTSLVKAHPYNSCPGCGYALDLSGVCWECGHTGESCVFFPQYGCKGCGLCSKS